MSEIKNDNEGNDWLPEISIPFPVVTEKDELITEYSFKGITLSAPFKDMKDGVRTSVSSLGTLQQIQMIMTNYITLVSVRRCREII